ncbi:MAG TPA: DUF4153 domain-containing protein [Feifaniaceae bacterium]|nr:DUF4153 domain-containing protein [Feifaniaceae bacterium]
MKCSACGNELRGEDRFCPACGLKAAAAPAPAAPQPERGQYFESAYTALRQAQEPRPVTAPQRWLLLGVILLGVVLQSAFSFVSTVSESSAGPYAVRYAAFWLTYIALFHIFCYKKAAERPLGLVLCGAAAFLCVMMTFQAYGYSDWSLLFLNQLAIPCLLMLHAQYVTQPLPRERESGYFFYFLTGFFVQPFENLGRFFAGAGSLFKAGEKGKHFWLGILVAVPVLAVVVSLLLSADAVMNALAIQVFGSIDLSDVIWRIFVVLICAMLFYSFLYGAAWGKKPEPAVREYKPLNATAPSVVLITLLIAYAVFTAVQFLYLFGGYGLPEGLTYSEYAVEGFNQLMWVAAINFSVLSLCICRVEEKAHLRVLMLLVLAATGVILASAFTRLSLYIGAYGLTFKRIQAFWFLCYLTAVLVLYGIRLYNKRLPLLRLSALIFVLWYAALNIPDLTAWYPVGA